MVTEQEALIERFDRELRQATAYVARDNAQAVISAQDLFNDAVERLLHYGRGEHWSHSDRLRSTDGHEVDKYVQRSLVHDLIDIMRAVGEHVLSADLIAEKQVEGYFGLTHEIQLTEEGESEDTANLYSQYPLLMAQVDGRTLDQIAEDHGLSKTQVNYRIAKEMGQARRMYSEKENSDA